MPFSGLRGTPRVAAEEECVVTQIFVSVAPAYKRGLCADAVCTHASAQQASRVVFVLLITRR